VEEEAARVVGLSELGQVTRAAFSGLDQMEMLFEVHYVLRAADVVERTVLLTVWDLVR
jgi:hypothetical protein